MAAGQGGECDGGACDQVNKDWSKLDNRVLGHILRSPATNLGVGEHRFTEDWGIFLVNRDKLGDGFQGNKVDLGSFFTIRLRPFTNLNVIYI